MLFPGPGSACQNVVHRFITTLLNTHKQLKTHVNRWFVVSYTVSSDGGESDDKDKAI